MSSANFHLRCTACDSTVPATVADLQCSVCGAVYAVAYTTPPSPMAPRLPLIAGQARVTLGEGNTPVIELRHTAEALGLETLWAKLEHVAPTGSFKDRGSAVLMSVALNHGVREFVEDSSGNAGASLAAYAAAAGLKAHIFAPDTASPGKLQQIEVFGADLHRVRGPRQASTDAARAFVAERGLPYLSHNMSPFFSEGMKAFGYEVARSPARAARHIVFPVGNGSLLIGAQAGYSELLESGAATDTPAFHCVQSEAVRPVVAVLKGQNWDFATAGRTVASGIAVSRPPRIEQAVDAVQDSGGAGVTVTDAAVLAWQRRLAVEEGIFCEPTSAAAFAGLESLLQSGAIAPGDSVLVPVTGTGLKEPLTA
jgi:threonine synthase